MAQDTPNPTEGAQKTEAQGRDNQFHYYSGGEVKELQHTRISPAYWALVSIVLVGAVIYFIVGGALGPNSHFGGFQPEGGSQANLQKLQGTLASANSANGYTSVDLNQLPIPAGQNINATIDKGAEVYQTYCIGCHGPNQDGNGVGAATLNPKPRNLRDGPFMQAMSYQRINTSLHKGVPGTAMPRWENTLTQDEISEVIAYVFSLTSPPPAATGQGTQADGTKSYVNGTQNSPTPITPEVGGNAAASTSTAPPSMSGARTPTGPSPEQGANMTNGSGGNGNSTTAPGLGSENNAPRAKSLPTSGGASAKPLLAPAPTPATGAGQTVKPGTQTLATSPAAPAPKPGAPTPATSPSPAGTTSAGNTAAGR